MEVSVACAEWLPHARTAAEALAAADAQTFWHGAVARAPSGGRALGVRDMLAWFDAARAIVAYNGHAFDMRVLRQYYDGNDARWDAHVGKMHDPFAGVTRAAGRRVKLDTLLELNGLERKAGAGQDAPRWWAEGRLQQLEQYCARDVRALSELALRAQVYVQRGVAADAVSIRHLFEDAARGASGSERDAGATEQEGDNDADPPAMGRRAAKRPRSYDEVRRRTRRRAAGGAARGYMMRATRQTGAKRDAIEMGPLAMARTVDDRYEWRDAGLKRRRTSARFGDG